jgi:hypothetical protein
MALELEQGVKVGGRSARRATGTAIIALVFLAICVCLFGLSWNGVSAGFLTDDAVYLMMADAFSPFRSADPGLSAYLLRQSIFPPLYPLLLATLGAGSTTLLWAHVITTTTLVLALVFYGLWIHDETRDRLAAIGLVVVFALLPGTLLHNLDILSECPYLLFSLAALCLAERVPGIPGKPGLAALCVALGTLTRSAGLSLAVAFAIWLLRHRVPGRSKWLAVVFLPSLVWLVVKARVLGNQGGSYGDFWLWLWGEFEHQPGAFLPMFLGNQFRGIWQGSLSDLDLRPSSLTQLVLGLVLVCAIPVGVQRLRAWRLDAWYLLVGGGMVLLYPFATFFNRLLLPWIPIVLFYAYLGARAATKRWGEVGGKPALAYAFIGIVMLAMLPSLAFMAGRFAEPVDARFEPWKHTRYWYRNQGIDKIEADVAYRADLIRASSDVGQWVPQGDCVFAVHTAIPMLYGKRIFRVPPAPSVDVEQFERRSRECRYFFLISGEGIIGKEAVGAFYPQERLPSDRLEILHVWDDSTEAGAVSAILLRTKPST